MTWLIYHTPTVVFFLKKKPTRISLKAERYCYLTKATTTSNARETTPNHIVQGTTISSHRLKSVSVNTEKHNLVVNIHYNQHAWCLPNHGEETETQTVWPHLKILWHGKDNSAGDSERSKKERKTEEEIWRWHQGMDRTGVWRFPEGSRRQGKVKRYCCNIVYGALTTIKVKGLRWQIHYKCRAISSEYKLLFALRLFPEALFLLPLFITCP